MACPIVLSSSLLLSSLELSDTTVYELEIRARLGTAARFCKAPRLFAPDSGVDARAVLVYAVKGLIPHRLHLWFFADAVKGLIPHRLHLWFVADHISNLAWRRSHFVPVRLTIPEFPQGLVRWTQYKIDSIR